MNRHLRRRLIASQDGAALMAAVYIATIVILTWVDKPLYELPHWLYTMLVPTSIFPGFPASDALWLGVPLTSLLVSALVWIAVGYLADWLYHPYD